MADHSEKKTPSGKQKKSEGKKISSLDILAMIIGEEKERADEEKAVKTDPQDPELRKKKLRECRDLLDSISGTQAEPDVDPHDPG